MKNNIKIIVVVVFKVEAFGNRKTKNLHTSVSESLTTTFLGRKREIRDRFKVMTFFLEIAAILGRKSAAVFYLLLSNIFHKSKWPST